MNTSTPLLEARRISKRFPGIQALDDVSVPIWPGEVLGIMGENGAGKSTLMKVLAGIYPADSGEVLLDGQLLRLRGVADAMARGIVLIHQELNLAENLSVAANVFLGREMILFGSSAPGRWLRLLNRAAMNRRTAELLRRVGLDVSPEERVSRLSMGQRQMVEIARALSLQARILIMDEPTSSLTQRETELLFEVIGDLKRAGISVVYISHRLAEVQRIADRVVVLRDGRNSGMLDRASITHQAIVQLMVGRELKTFYHREPHAALSESPPRLEVRELRYADGPATPVSFRLFGGEIVGMAGLVGAGRTELAEALFGMRRITAGTVLLDGAPAMLRHPRQAIRAGLLLAPENRRDHGLVLLASVQRNIGLPNLDWLSTARIVKRREEWTLARRMCDSLRIRTPSVRQPVGLLSGGNQQKVVLGKWLARQPRVFLLDEPTRGVDVGAKSEIYALMQDLAKAGVAILVISSDLEEILGVSDRVLVLHEGRLAGELARNQLSEEAVMNLATGGSMESLPLPA